MKYIFLVFCKNVIDNLTYNIAFIPMTFNNPLNACFSNKKYTFNPNAHDTNCKSIFLNKKTNNFSGFLKIIGLQL